MSNPQDNKRSEQREKPRSGQQNESDSKPESRHGQGGRPGESQSQDSMGNRSNKKGGSTDELDEEER